MRTIYGLAVCLLCTSALLLSKSFDATQAENHIRQNIEYFEAQLTQLNYQNRPEFWHAYTKNLLSGDPRTTGPATFNEIPQIEQFIKQQWPKESTKRDSYPKIALGYAQNLRDIIETYSMGLENSYELYDTEPIVNITELIRQLTGVIEEIKSKTFTSRTYRVPYELLLQLSLIIQKDMKQAETDLIVHNKSISQRERKPSQENI
ncbi:MAG: hypothetical protein UU47_C0004G0039 [candidate division TM6 bacterium GW2011_GWE2_41_16]|nr:MAG: hypothetical protein UU47_C0004G0039 [candidate division TM6 bacterium GW2011_GWE2_41_16]